MSSPKRKRTQKRNNSNSPEKKPSKNRKWWFLAIFACCTWSFFASIFGDRDNRQTRNETSSSEVRPSRTPRNLEEVTQVPDVVVSTNVPATVRVVPTVQIVATVRATTVVQPTATIQIASSYRMAYAISDGTNLRSCPQTTCDRVGRLSTGSNISITGEVEGESVNGSNAKWYVTTYNNQTAYVYSGVITFDFVAVPATPLPNSAVVVPNSIAPSNAGGSSNNGSSGASVPSSSIISGGSCAGFDTAVCGQWSRPRVCDDAVAMGIPAREAACCFSHLDRDSDGFACYGN
jgi:hypothetical protein